MRGCFLAAARLSNIRMEYCTHISIKADQRLRRQTVWRTNNLFFSSSLHKNNSLCSIRYESHSCTSCEDGDEACIWKSVFKNQIFHIATNPTSPCGCRGGSRGGGDWGDCPLKPTKITLFTMVLQFGKQHSRYKAILSSIALSQQCCEVGRLGTYGHAGPLDHGVFFNNVIRWRFVKQYKMFNGKLATCLTLNILYMLNENVYLPCVVQRTSLWSLRSYSYKCNFIEKSIFWRVWTFCDFYG